MGSDELAERRYLLVKRGLYYGADNMGYTGVKEQAGRYTQDDADFYADDDCVTAIIEDEAPMFAPACWNEVKVEYLLTQIEALTAQLAEARESERAAIERADQAKLDGVRAGIEAMRQCVEEVEGKGLADYCAGGITAEAIAKGQA